MNSTMVVAFAEWAVVVEINRESPDLWCFPISVEYVLPWQISRYRCDITERKAGKRYAPLHRVSITDAEDANKLKNTDGNKV